MLVGIPYPNLLDYKLNLKKNYLNSKPTTTGFKKLTGDDWYQL